MLGLVDGITPEDTIGTEDAEGNNIGTMLSLGTCGTLGLGVVDETYYGIFLKEGKHDTLGLTRLCDTGIHS